MQQALLQLVSTRPIGVAAQSPATVDRCPIQWPGGRGSGDAPLHVRVQAAGIIAKDGATDDTRQNCRAFDRTCSARACCDCRRYGRLACERRSACGHESVDVQFYNLRLDDLDQRGRHDQGARACGQRRAKAAHQRARLVGLPGLDELRRSTPGQAEPVQRRGLHEARRFERFRRLPDGSVRACHRVVGRQPEVLADAGDRGIRRRLRDMEQRRRRPAVDCARCDRRWSILVPGHLGFCGPCRQSFRQRPARHRRSRSNGDPRRGEVAHDRLGRPIRGPAAALSRASRTELYPAR